MKCVKCFLMEDLTGALFLGHFYICAWCILAAPSRTAWQAACSSCLCLCAPLLLLVGQVLFLRDLSVPVECPSPRYLSSSQHALSCMHKGRILFQGRQQTVPRLFSVCDAAGRLSAARPVCVCGGAEVCGSPDSCRGGYRFVGWALCLLHLLAGGQDFLPGNNRAGAGPSPHHTSGTRSGLLGLGARGSSGHCWSCHSCCSIRSGLSWSPLATCGSVCV